VVEALGAAHVTQLGGGDHDVAQTSRYVHLDLHLDWIHC